MQVLNRNVGNGHKGRWLRVVALVIAWLIIISLARDVWQIRVGFSRITESQKRLEDEQLKNASLKKKMELVATEGYREKQIREKLNMQKEGEVIVVMPRKGLGDQVFVEEELERVQLWQKWLNILK